MHTVASAVLGAMPRYWDVRNQFYAGVVSKEFFGSEFEQSGGGMLKTGLNVSLTDAGTLRRRPGADRLATSEFDGRGFEFTMPDGTLRHLIFSDGLVRIYLVDGTQQSTKLGPWTSSDIFEMAIAKSTIAGESAVYIAHHSFPTQILSWDGTVWNLGPFVFRTTASGRKSALFSRFDDDPITMQLSSYSGGTATMTFSAPVLESGHEGVLFAYMGRNQVRVTSVTNATTAQVQIIDRIYPTLLVTVADSSPYVVGDSVVGDVTSVQGQVVAVSGNTLSIVLSDGYSDFLAADGDAPGENLVGPGGAEEVTAVSTRSTPLGTNVWLEETISAVRGYPGACAFHRNRLCFAAFPSLGNHVAASAVEAADDFDLGGGNDDDALFEVIGTDPDEQILHLVSSDTLLVLTEGQVLFVSEASGRRFIPSGIGFIPIEDDAATRTPPAVAPEGVAFVDVNGRVLLVRNTGDGDVPYSIADLTELAYPLVSSPKQLVFADGIGDAKRRALAVLNADGSMAMLIARRDQGLGGFFQWTRGAGQTWQSVWSWRGDLFSLSSTPAGRFIERFSDAQTVDSAFVATAGSAQPNETADATLNRQVIEQVSFDAAGTLTATYAFFGGETIGYDFPLQIEPAPYYRGQAGRQRTRVAKAHADVMDTGTFRMEGRLLQSYGSSDDVEAQPALVDHVYRASSVGGAGGATILIEQKEGEGAPFHLRELAMEVFAR